MEILDFDGVVDSSGSSSGSVPSPDMVDGTDGSDLSGFDIGDTDFTADDSADNTQVQSSNTVVYVDKDFLVDTLDNLCVPAFSVGFGFATLLVLVTYGVFKAIGFVRIKN